MKIAFYEPPYSKAHPHQWTLRGGYKYPSLLTALRGRAEIIIAQTCCPPQDDPHRKVLEESFGVRFVPVAARPSAVALRDVALLGKTVAEALQDEHVDVLSNLNGRKIFWCLSSALAARRLGARYVYRVGGDDIRTEQVTCQSSGRPYIGHAAYWDNVNRERLLVEGAARVIVMSPWEKERLAALSTRSDNISICWRGVDLDHFAPVGRTPDRPVRRFLFVGRDSYEKGFDILQAAASLMARTHPDAEIRVVGPFEPGRKGNMTYLGYIGYDELPAAYAEADALVLSSRTEGLPQVLMEGMAAGLPCIVSRHLFKTMLDHGKTGLLCDLDATHVYQLMVSLYEDPALAHAIGSAGRAMAARDFDLDQSARRYADAVLGP